MNYTTSQASEVSSYARLKMSQTFKIQIEGEEYLNQIGNGLKYTIWFENLNSSTTFQQQLDNKLAKQTPLRHQFLIIQFEKGYIRIDFGNYGLKVVICHHWEEIWEEDPQCQTAKKLSGYFFLWERTFLKQMSAETLLTIPIILQIIVFPQYDLLFANCQTYSFALYWIYTFIDELYYYFDEDDPDHGDKQAVFNNIQTNKFKSDEYCRYQNKCLILHYEGRIVLLNLKTKKLESTSYVKNQNYITEPEVIELEEFQYLVDQFRIPFQKTIFEKISESFKFEVKITNHSQQFENKRIQMKKNLSHA